MKLLHTTTDGESSYDSELRSLLGRATTTAKLAAHRLDRVFVAMYAAELQSLGARGVRVQLLLSSAHLSAARGALTDLSAALPLLEVRVASNLHAKLFLLDEEYLLLGSANLSGDSFGRGSDRDDGVHHWNHPNFELGILLADRTMVAEALALFGRHWDKAAPWT
jgi:phosphatidylserine/phosphatidylglycerophosphate/cardiolipin synthase-like enzyme